MSISISERKVKGKVYISIVEKYRDPITKRSTTRQLKSYGNKELFLQKHPDGLELINSDLKLFRESTQAYAEATELPNGSGVSIVDSAANSTELGSSFLVSPAPFLTIWNKLELDQYFKNLERNYRGKVPVDLNKLAFYNAVARILRPESKLGTWIDRNRYLYDFESLSLKDMYNLLDILDERKQKIIDRLNAAIDKLYQRDLTIALYDVTTFYFESFIEDELRARGMSKEHRTQETQVVMGLLVDSEGIPFGYELFRGNTAEVGTMLEVVEGFKKRYQLNNVTIIADAGLNQLINLESLEQAGFKYIVGYPPYVKLNRTEQDSLLEEDGWESYDCVEDSWRIKRMALPINKRVYPKGEQSRKIQLEAECIATFSLSRYKHDLDELRKKTTRAKELVRKGAKAVQAANRNGYKSFIKSELKEVQFNETLYTKRLKWCGYTALLTNIEDQDPSVIYALLRQLWRIEDNFRVLKTTIEARPVYVWTTKHIRGHFVLCYISLVLTRLMQKQLKEDALKYSVRQVVEALNALSVSPLNALRKSKSQLYQCVVENSEGSTSSGEYKPLLEIANDIWKLCGLEPLTRLESHGSLVRKLGRNFKIR